jgi:hypothetical protein
MGARREDVDLWLVITDPVCARKFIEDYNAMLPPAIRIERVELETGRTIWLKTMTDDDAPVAAAQILREFEIPHVMNTKALEKWEH